MQGDRSDANHLRFPLLIFNSPHRGMLSTFHYFDGIRTGRQKHGPATVLDKFGTEKVHGQT